ncbi:MAG: hypothetical protein H6682_09750 [Candidatus Eisenbacteria bacterium]|nr:hypothetical protein [Candidatus Eisenbacteria bacterium]
MTTIGNPAANYSLGTQINRALDSLGYPDAFGDALGALVDLRSGNVAGALRNLVDLNSGLSTRQMDSIFGGARRPGFARAFAPRCGCTGGHLHAYKQTYAVREQVGKRAHVGERYGFNWGPFKLQGRISGQQYAGSFAKPIKLADGDYLYRGRKYDSMGDIFRDAKDGRIDGQATTYKTRTKFAWHPGNACAPRPFFPPSFAFHPAMNAIGGAGAALGNALGGGIQDILGKLFGGANGANGSNGTNGSNGSNGSNGTNGVGSTDSVLSDPSLSLEDKLALLMAKLTEHMDKQIEQKMKDIETQMTNEKNGGANGSNGSNGGGGIGGIFGSIGKAVGGLFGGLLGGGGSSSAGGANGSSSQNSSNLQLLQTQLQQLMQKRQQMFQTMSNILKSLHDTSMNTIRQLKA